MNYIVTATDESCLPLFKDFLESLFALGQFQGKLICYYYYKNDEKDYILEQLQTNLPEKEKIKLYKDLQDIFYEDQPVTFLYWFDNIIAYNKKISRINFSILGLVKNAWEWSFK